MLAMLLLAACVSTSTGTKKPEADIEQAALKYYELGARYYRAGNYELARARLMTALDYNPKMAVAHSTLALTYLELDNVRLATDHYDMAVKAEPDNFNVRNAYAVFLCQQREYEEATKQFDKVANTYNNDDAEVTLTNAGVCMTNKPDFAAAEQYFRKALEIKPSFGEALLQMSSLKYKTEDYLRARAFMQRYLASNEGTSPVIFLAYQIENSAGDSRAATDFTNQLLSEFPDSREAEFLRNNK